MRFLVQMDWIRIFEKSLLLEHYSRFLLQKCKKWPFDLWSNDLIFILNLLRERGKFKFAAKAKWTPTSSVSTDFLADSLSVGLPAVLEIHFQHLLRRKQQQPPPPPFFSAGLYANLISPFFSLLLSFHYPELFFYLWQTEKQTDTSFIIFTQLLFLFPLSSFRWSSASSASRSSWLLSSPAACALAVPDFAFFPL